MNFAHIAQTYSYFKTKYGENPGANFWTTTYDEEQPIRYAREATLQDEIRIKVQQLLMKQNGIITDAGYNAFLSQWSDENSKRQRLSGTEDRC
ncbi:hypothetical protein [Paenibacillus sp. Soil522]|uniref:hypothetical protein n=1 Tax=Paenibacillus sp. Soil522 TaxID=1736388 RepID=UPI0006FC3043|nr:hypothetical protein [Paenibacillus sp. Soil522]KRE34417.1 hypothetical protein ASG81_22950 [Paenibacillus sp. Soil522]